MRHASRGKTGSREGGYDVGANRATGQRRRLGVGSRGDERRAEESVAAGSRAAKMSTVRRDACRSWGRCRHLEEEEPWW